VGDIVGYGADPSSCVEIVMAKSPLVVAGNHDWAAVGKGDIDGFNEFARQAVVWTMSQLQPNQREYLAKLELEEQLDDILIVHGSPEAPEKWHYIIDRHDARDALTLFDCRICVVGHSHVPFIFGAGPEDECFFTMPGSYRLLPGWKYVVNTGSVGQPRDGNNHASLFVLDLDTSTIDLVRAPYALEQAQNKIRAVPQLHDFLAQRLAWGY
jgi:diadenosine tetraphosphatase ApaH/serine/threonine PP2A family protein phosphatase